MSPGGRERIRDAFHGAYGDRYWRPGLEDRVMATAGGRRREDGRRGDRPLWLATAVAVLLAGLVVGTLLLLARGPLRPQPAPASHLLPYVSAAPLASSTPTPPTPPTASPPAGDGPAWALAHPCRSSQLSLEIGRRGVALGHASLVLTFRNQSKQACSLYGFPGLQMLGPRGEPLPTSVNWGSDYIVQPETPTLVLLQPGDRASFLLGYSSPSAANLTCPTSAELEVTPPNETQSLVIAFQLTPADTGADGLHLQCGRFTVSPVYAGTGPQPGP